jgi:hypothetical protein
MEDYVIPAFCQIHVDLGDDRAAQANSYVCAACEDKLYGVLEDIHNMYHVVDDIEFLAGTRDRATANTKSVPPMSLHAVSLTDHRSVYARRGDPISATRVLGTWCQATADTRGKVLPPGLLKDAKQQCVWLITSLPWLMQQPSIARFARHMGAVRSALSVVAR